MIIRKRGEKTRYYYYKKKRGRHKKTGPKPKKVIKPRKKINWDYKIVVTSNNKQIEYINVYTSLEKALKAFDEFKNENDKIIFPVKYINYKGIKEANYEYLLLKRFYENDSKVTKLRNQYGKLSDHFIINDENWIIYDKMPKLIEETFWVYGFHPKMQRKTFMWIYNSLIVDKVKNKYDFLRIFLFKNKDIPVTNINITAAIKKYTYLLFSETNPTDAIVNKDIPGSMNKNVYNEYCIKLTSVIPYAKFCILYGNNGTNLVIIKRSIAFLFPS